MVSNVFRNEKDEPIELLEVDNDEVRRSQIARLEKVKTERNTDEVNEKLTAIEEAAKTGEGNLLTLAVDAARSRATLGEISMAMEKAFRSLYGHHPVYFRSLFQRDEKRRKICPCP